MQPDQTLSAAAFAALIGVEPRRIATLHDHGGLPAHLQGGVLMVPREAGLAWFLAHQVDRARRRRAPDAQSARAQHRERRELAEARLAEHRLERELGKYLDVDTAAAEVRQYQERVRATLMAARSRYADRVPAPVLHEVITGILRDLQRDAAEWAASGVA